MNKDYYKNIEAFIAEMGDEEEWGPFIDKNNRIVEQFEVSSYGQIRETATGKMRKVSWMKPNKNLYKDEETAEERGLYWYFSWFVDGVKYREYIHRLVAKNWCPNPNNDPLVLHKDENSANPNRRNLIWGTHSENKIRHNAHKKKLAQEAQEALLLVALQDEVGEDA